MLEFSEIKTQAHVKELYHYNKTTGVFTLKRKPYPTYSKRIGDEVGHTSSLGYSIVQYNKKVYSLHRLAFLWMDGNIPKYVDHIDHIDQNRKNNKWDNLRRVTMLQNNRNRTLNKNNTTGFAGVQVQRNKYVASIYVKNTRISLGSFKHKQDAIDARKHAEKLYGFHKNHGKEK